MKPEKKYPLFLALLIVFIFIIHSIALYFSLYWRIRWFDNVPHFLGGFWLGAAALWFIYLSGKIKSENLSFYFVLLFAVSFASLIGVVWELYEVLTDFFIANGFPANIDQLGLRDTMTDLFFDLLGALSAGLIFIKKLSKYKNGE